MSDVEKMQPLHHCGTQVIKTERLTLRPFRTEDSEDMFRWASNPEVTRFLPYLPYTSIEESSNICNIFVDAYSDLECYIWAIEFESKAIGLISVPEVDSSCFSCHLAWQLDEPYWNRGIMTEAAKAVIDYLFSNVGFDRITSGHDLRNIGSGRIMQKIGMTCEGVFKRYCYQTDGSIGDKAYYAILKSEWESKKLPNMF